MYLLFKKKIFQKQKKEEIGDSSELYDDYYYDYGECEENNEDVKNVIGKHRSIRK